MSTGSPRARRPSRTNAGRAPGLLETLEPRTLLSGTAGFSATADAVPPSARIQTIDLTREHLTSHGMLGVNIDYDGDIPFGSLDVNDIVVTAPNGSEVEVSGLSVATPMVAPGPDGIPYGGGLLGGYALVPPGGEWDAADNGIYTVTLRPGAVTDRAGVAVPSVSGKFVVAIDVVATTATIAPTRYPGNGFDAIKVMFSGPVRPGSVDVNDIVVTGPGRQRLIVISAEAKTVGDDLPQPPWEAPLGRPVMMVPGAVYTIEPPGGAWDASDDGMYTVSLAPAEIRDENGNPVLQTSQVIQVPIAGSPTATAYAPDVNPAGGANHTVTVVYADNLGIYSGTIDVSDIVVNGPGGPVTVLGVTTSVTDMGRVVTASYTIAAPGGTWDEGDAGAYTVNVVGSAVTDTVGNPVPPSAALFVVPPPAPPGPPPPGGDLVAEFAPRDQPNPRFLLKPGQRSVVRVTIRNAGDAPVVGRASVRLLARTITPFGGQIDRELATTPSRPIRLRPGQSRVVPVRFNHAETGGYRIVAKVDPAGTVPERNESNNEAHVEGPFQIVPPISRAEGVGIGPLRGDRLHIGRRNVIPVAVWSTGNVDFDGVMTFDLYASAGLENPGPPARLNAETFTRRIRLRAGQGRLVKFRIPIGESFAPGLYRLSAAVHVAPETGDAPTFVDGRHYLAE